MAKGDRDAAVNEFVELNKTLNLTVHRRALLCALIKEEDTVNLQRVVDITTERYGEVSSLYDLIECFLLLGQYQQVRKLIDTPGLRYREDMVKKVCNSLVGNNNLEALDKFVSFSKSIFGCDREFLYRTLLGAHKRDADKVMEIWLLMQEEGVVATRSLKKLIRDACVDAGKDDPFAVNRAQN